MQPHPAQPLAPDYFSALLVCAAILIGLTRDFSTAGMVFFVALANFAFSRFVLQTRTFQPKANHQVPQLYREIIIYAARRVFILWIIVLIVALSRSFSLAATARFAAAIAVAGVPMGLAGFIAWLRESSPHTDGPKAVRPVAAAILSTVAPIWSALGLVLCSLLAAATFHVSLGISLPQLVALDILVVLPCLVAQRRDHPEPGAPAIRYWPYGALLSRRHTTGLLWSGLLAGILACTNYILFFERQGLSAEYIAPGSHIHEQATALAFATLVLCVLAGMVQRRSQHGLFTRYQLHNRQLYAGLAFALLSTLLIIYTPGLSQLFEAAPIGLGDWLYALAAMVIFILAREFERHTRWHNHAQLFARHHPAKIKKHLKLV